MMSSVFVVELVNYDRLVITILYDQFLPRFTSVLMAQLVSALPVCSGLMSVGSNAIPESVF